MPFHLILPIFIFSISFPMVSHADEPQVSITKKDGYIYISSNGLPNHATGQFPNSGNPNAISAQSHNFRVPENPTKNARSERIHGLTGVALNGVPIDPGTAETWNNNRQYRYEAINSSINLGLDQNNAHVQPTGTYHYHGIPTALVKDGLTHVGYAADGFKIYADSQNRYKSSYRLKAGQRSGGPGGTYNGDFSSDYEYVADLSALDECNGAIVDGSYAYFATEGYPFYPRCLYGDADPSFDKQRGGEEAGRRGPPNGEERGNRPPPRDGRRGPPPRF